MRYSMLLIAAAFILGCQTSNKRTDPANLDQIATDYVRLGLDIGQYDADFVDAYYGPDSLKPQSRIDTLPKALFLSRADSLQDRLAVFLNMQDDPGYVRAKFLSRQLRAFKRRLRIISGEYGSFDKESEELFGVIAPRYKAAHFQAIIDSLDLMLPGKGDVQTRFQELANRFIIPSDKLDTVFKRTIQEARSRSLEHLDLPGNETFNLEYVTGKSWSGYNWYQGNFSSLIQINTDTDIFLERAIDVGSHESYPGHHVYNMLLEKNLYRDKGWIEISLYPLFSPQSFIAEGSANYGIDLAFPDSSKISFAKNTLLPLAGLDTSGLSSYFRALELKGKLNYARNEAARGLVNNTMTEAEALIWLQKYCLFNKPTAEKSIAFIRKYRSYVINYNYGRDLVKQFIESGPTNETHWEKFNSILIKPVDPRTLIIQRAKN